MKDPRKGKNTDHLHFLFDVFNLNLCAIKKKIYREKKWIKMECWLQLDELAKAELDEFVLQLGHEAEME